MIYLNFIYDINKESQVDGEFYYLMVEVRIFFNKIQVQSPTFYSTFTPFNMSNLHSLENELNDEIKIACVNNNKKTSVYLCNSTMK